MSQCFRILFITSNLRGGGAERALVNILNHLDRAHFEPHLALYQEEGVFLRDLASDVPVYEIQPQDLSFLQRNWVRIRAVKRVCEQIQPALVMSVLWQANIVTLLSDAVLGLGCPVLTNEQNPPAEKLAHIWQRHVYWPLARLAYQRAARVVTISAGIASQFRRLLSVAEHKLVIIPNPISLQDIRTQSAQQRPRDIRTHPRLIAVGSMKKQKNYPLLLRAFSRLTQEESAHLYILGDGPERSRLEELIDALDLAPLVRLVGFRENPFVYLRQADLFVLSSDYEGFGNVLVEAMALGVPVVSTDCPYGPREILVDGEYGVLVPPRDADALAAAILSLLRQPSRRRKLAAAGQKRAADFAIEAIVPQYEKLFRDLIENTRE